MNPPSPGESFLQRLIADVHRDREQETKESLD